MKHNYIKWLVVAAWPAAVILNKKDILSEPNTSNLHYMMADTVKPSVIIEKITLEKMNVLYIPDTSEIATLTKAFESGYAELFSFIGSKGLKPGKVMAFYHNYADPISLEIAVEVDKIPSVLEGRLRSKVVEGGEAVVVHYTGPYEQMDLPYHAITRWLKENNREAKGMPFESYLNDPAMVKDKYQLKTDIYQMLK
jgi:effector-binding domain-containing protein